MTDSIPDFEQDLFSALRRRCVEDLRAALARRNPTDHRHAEILGQLLMDTAEMGYVEGVRELIAVTHSSYFSPALVAAAEYGHLACLDLLAPLSGMDADTLLTVLTKGGERQTALKKEREQRLVQAARAGLLEGVRELIAQVDARFEDSRALQQAVVGGHTECVKLLIPVSDPTARDNLALLYAVEGGRFECAQVLLPVSNPQSLWKALLQAVKRNAPNFVEWLGAYCTVPDLERVVSEALSTGLGEENTLLCLINTLSQLGPSKDKRELSVALGWAAHYGRVACVQALIPLADARFRNNAALEAATQHAHFECMEILLPYSDAHRVLEQLNGNSQAQAYTAGREYLEALIVQKDNATLTAATKGLGVGSGTRKI